MTTAGMRALSAVRIQSVECHSLAGEGIKEDRLCECRISGIRTPKSLGSDFEDPGSEWCSIKGWMWIHIRAIAIGEEM